MKGVMAVCAALCALPAAAPAQAALPKVKSGHRPGPDVLYEAPPRAPQLENAAPWRADPILISGASAYREGEFLYQDWIYDDHGAAGLRDPSDPFGLQDFLFSPKAGTLTYPDDPVYAGNAADLVELRVRPLEGATAFRFTLNSMRDPERVAVIVALGDGPAVAWPHGAGVRSPAARFLTVHGATAELRDASGAVVQPAPSASVDAERRQIDVRVPHAAWAPGRGVVRMAAGVGLWDAEAGALAAPGAVRTASGPGGVAASGARLFNLAFRAHEPVPDVAGTGLGITIADAAVGAAALGSWWRERAQADALASGDVAAFAAQVDFGRLHDRVTDDSAVPAAGPMDRILASAAAPGQGFDPDRGCGGIAPGERCDGMLAGQLQPYALYVPARPAPASGFGLTLLLHSLSANYNQYLGSRNQSQLAERDAGVIVATPSGRGPDGFYHDLAEADAFEVWADVARHYPLDPEWVSVSGYSMGGFGTFRMLSRWPDLFARGFSVVGAADEVEHLPSLRNTPLMSWAAALDELVHLTRTEETAAEMERLGLPFEHRLFPAADHLSLASYDEYRDGAAFLGAHRVNRDPAHVTYVVDPRRDSERAGAVADHVHWLSDLRVRDPQASPTALVDVRSGGFGLAERGVRPLESATGTIEGGSRGPQPYVARRQEQAEPEAAAPEDRLYIRARNLAGVTVDARRARVSCAPDVVLESDGPLALRVACPPAPPRCGRRIVVRLPRVRGRRIVRVVVRRGGRTLGRARGRDLRRIAVRRPTRRAFRVRVRARVSGGGRTITVVRRFRACRR